MVIEWRCVQESESKVNCTCFHISAWSEELLGSQHTCMPLRKVFEASARTLGRSGLARKGFIHHRGLCYAMHLLSTIIILVYGSTAYSAEIFLSSSYKYYNTMIIKYTYVHTVYWMII